MVLQPWIIVCLNPLWDERSFGNRAAPGFDSDGSRNDKQTPRRISVRRSILRNPGRRRTAKLIFRDKKIQQRSVREGGGGQNMLRTIETDGFVVSSVDERFEFVKKKRTSEKL